MARYVAVAIVVGLVIAFARGGRVRHLAAARFRWPYLVVVALALQAIIEVDRLGSTEVLVASYAMLLTFCAVNLRIVGMGIVAIGLALNAIVITVNGGMPVRVGAVYEAGILEPSEPLAIDQVKRHVEADDDRLTFLGDIIPVRPLQEVLSFGDLVLSVGIADLLVHLMRGGSTRRRRRAAVGLHPPAV